MADVTTEFFERLREREHEPMLGRTNGSLRIDLHRDGLVERQWRVEVRRGALTVSQEAGPADCIIRTEAHVFEDLARGHANALAATLRGELELDGDPAMLVRFQRLFPAPTGRKRTSSARCIGRRRG